MMKRTIGRAGAKQIASATFCLAFTLGVAACGNHGSEGGAGGPFTPGEAGDAASPLSPPELSDDAFAYCAAAGDVDEPGEPYAGAAAPQEIVEALTQALDLPPGMFDEAQAQGIYWRCMDGRVYGCYVGANIPCWDRADTSTEPNEGMRMYCEDDPDAEVIPAVATGRATVYAWRCRDGAPEIVKQVDEADARGYPVRFWHQLTPPAPAIGSQVEPPDPLE